MYLSPIFALFSRCLLKKLYLNSGISIRYWGLILGISIIIYLPLFLKITSKWNISLYIKSIFEWFGNCSLELYLIHLSILFIIFDFCNANIQHYFERYFFCFIVTTICSIALGRILLCITKRVGKIVFKYIERFGK